MSATHPLPKIPTPAAAWNVTITPSELHMMPGASAFVTVKLPTRSPLPIRVALRSSNPGVAKVSRTLVLQPGARVARFAVSACGIGPAEITASMPAKMRSLRAEVRVAVADFLVTPNPAEERQAVSVDARTVARAFDAGRIEWNWGDATRESVGGAAPLQHVYTAPGRYRIAMKAFGMNDSTPLCSAEKEIEIRKQPPAADFTWSPEPATAGQPVQFHDIIRVAFDSVSWQWEGGRSCSDAGPAVKSREYWIHHPSHTFPRPGKVPVTLTVKRGTEVVGVATHEVTIR